MRSLSEFEADLLSDGLPNTPPRSLSGQSRRRLVLKRLVKRGLMRIETLPCENDPEQVTDWYYTTKMGLLILGLWKMLGGSSSR